MTVFPAYNGCVVCVQLSSFSHYDGIFPCLSTPSKKDEFPSSVGRIKVGRKTNTERLFTLMRVTGKVSRGFHFSALK